MKNVSKFLECTAFHIKKEALKLKGVKQYYIEIQEFEKLNLMKEIYQNFSMDMTMIFVNKKDTAKALQEKLKSLNISAEILIGGDFMDKA